MVVLPPPSPSSSSPTPRPFGVMLLVLLFFGGAAFPSWVVLPSLRPLGCRFSSSSISGWHCLPSSPLGGAVSPEKTAPHNRRRGRTHSTTQKEGEKSTTTQKKEGRRRRDHQITCVSTCFYLFFFDFFNFSSIFFIFCTFKFFFQ